MRITKKLQIVPLAALSLGIASLCSAQSDAPYTEGPVWTVTMVKTKTGMTDEYLKELAKTLKGTLEEAKKQNLVLDYKILLGNPIKSLGSHQVTVKVHDEIDATVTLNVVSG